VSVDSREQTTNPCRYAKGRCTSPTNLRFWKCVRHSPRVVVRLGFERACQQNRFGGPARLLAQVFCGPSRCAKDPLVGYWMARWRYVDVLSQLLGGKMAHAFSNCAGGGGMECSGPLA